MTKNEKAEQLWERAKRLDDAAHNENRAETKKQMMAEANEYRKQARKLLGL